MSSFDSHISTEIESNISYSSLSNNVSPIIINGVTKLLKGFINSSSNIINSHFTAPYLPEISIEDYLIRIIENTQIEESTLISSLIYIERLILKTNTKITDLDIHRLLLTSIILSIKYNEDKIYPQHYYANIGGIKTEELNILECEFLNGIEFALFINDTEFNSFKELLFSNISLKEKETDFCEINDEEFLQLEDDDFETEEEIIIQF
jgi:hypothetical protein